MTAKKNVGANKIGVITTPRMVKRVATALRKAAAKNPPARKTVVQMGTLPEKDMKMVPGTVCLLVMASPKVAARIRRLAIKAGATRTMPRGKPTGDGLAEVAAVLTASLATTKRKAKAGGRIASTR
jgi:gamma-glutamyl phosphate reductase